MSLTSEIPLLLSILFSLTSAMPSPQNGDGGGGTAPSGGLGYDPSALGSSDAGSSGSGNSWGLSTGATVAISVVVALVVITGITTMILFYLSKKRQWNLRDRARGSLRRVGTGLQKVMTPRTPHKMTFSPIMTKQSRFAPSDKTDRYNNNNESTDLLNKPQSSPPKNQQWGRDLEKALPEPSLSSTYIATITGPASTQSQSHSRGPSQSRSASHTRGLSLNTTDIPKEGGGRTGQRIKEMKKPSPIPVSMAPQSKFDMDSPRTPFLSRFVFGRR